MIMGAAGVVQRGTKPRKQTSPVSLICKSSLSSSTWPELTTLYCLTIYKGLVILSSRLHRLFSFSRTTCTVLSIFLLLVLLRFCLFPMAFITSSVPTCFARHLRQGFTNTTTTAAIITTSSSSSSSTFLCPSNLSYRTSSAFITTTTKGFRKFFPSQQQQQQQQRNRCVVPFRMTSTTDNEQQKNGKVPVGKDPSSVTESEWLKVLTREEFHILREKGTERPGTGEYDGYYPKEGYFACRACGNPLYSAESKFKSGCGWPAFDKCYKDSVETNIDNSFFMRRIEIVCARCKGHLGHVFEGERMTPTNERHCVNSVSVKYMPGEAGKQEGKVL